MKGKQSGSKPPPEKNWHCEICGEELAIMDMYIKEEDEPDEGDPFTVFCRECLGKKIEEVYGQKQPS